MQCCNVLMKIDQSNYLSYCENCGKEIELYGCIGTDEDLYHHNRSKVHPYNPTRHCKAWLDKIQGKERLNILSIHIDKLKSAMDNDKIDYMDATLPISVYRLYLKKCKLSKYNEHVNKIRQLISSYYTPQLEYDDCKIINYYFRLVLKAFDKLKSSNKNNLPYHPYFIFKIIEEKIKDKSILKFIHLQSNKTLIKHDILWKKICELTSLTYHPTELS